MGRELPRPTAGEAGKSPGGPPRPYSDIELCFRAGREHVALARSVAAEIAQCESADPVHAERVRVVVGAVVSALMLLADDDAKVRCAFRVMDGQIRANVSVRGRTAPSPEAKAEHARLLDRLVVSASTITVPREAGGFAVVTDAVIPVDGKGV